MMVQILFTLNLIDILYCMIILIRCLHCKKLTNMIDPSITERTKNIFEFVDIPCSWCDKNMTLSEYDIFDSGVHHTIQDKILEEFLLSEILRLPLEAVNKDCKIEYS